MHESLVTQPYNGEARASSKLIAEGFGVEHRAVVALINKYRMDFEDFGKMPAERSRSRQILNDISNVIKNVEGVGKKELVYFLNEEQATFLGTLMRNSDQSVPFKKRLVKDYAKCKKALAGIKGLHDSPEWESQRIEGKQARREETDWIQTFVEYARGQGSSSPDMYFMNITKMENAALFVVQGKFKNLRDVMTAKQLKIIGVADDIVKKALREGMMAGMPYKEIYQLAKANVLQFAAVYGKSDVVAQMLLEEL